MVYALAWVVLSMMLPRASTDPGVVLPGAVLVGITLAGMQAVSQLYLPDRLSRASELYGAIGTTIVTLGWFFILGRAMVLAMVLNAVISRALREHLAVRVLTAGDAHPATQVSMGQAVLRPG